jgi:uncharacterized protein YigE (DUF2233 family)
MFMKRLSIYISFLVLLFAIIFISSAVFIINKKPKINPQIQAQQTERESTQDSDYYFDWEGQKLIADWFMVENLTNLSLHTNLEEKLTSRTAKKNYNCASLVNAGFYSKQYTHIGLFISDSKEISAYTKNSLFNGILSVNTLLTPRITATPPSDSLITAVQSGPVLIENSFVKKLNVSADKARRVIAAVNGNNQLIFIVIYDVANSQNGPDLSQLPAIVKDISDKNNLNIADAINLDGGSASSYYHENKSLSEISTIGGFFCIQ